MGVRSVKDAILDHHILDAFESKHYSSAIFLDVKEACDRVWPIPPTKIIPA